jgi:hypothetical protein
MQETEWQKTRRLFKFLPVIRLGKMRCWRHVNEDSQTKDFTQTSISIPPGTFEHKQIYNKKRPKTKLHASSWHLHISSSGYVKLSQCGHVFIVRQCSEYSLFTFPIHICTDSNLPLLCTRLQLGPSHEGKKVEDGCFRTRYRETEFF